VKFLEATGILNITHVLTFQMIMIVKIWVENLWAGHILASNLIIPRNQIVLCVSLENENYIFIIFWEG